MHILDLFAQLWVFLHDTLNVTHRVLRCWQARGIGSWKGTNPMQGVHV